MNSPWISFLYQYCISGIVFIVGIVLAIRKGAINLRYPHDRWTVVQLVLGFFAMIFFHCALLIAAGV
ncbi:MAG: hypothetical protein N2316_01590 [Spirochaetes bacterium]|nr:hypothetical protein [Spirochaetota bacterium]